MNVVFIVFVALVGIGAFLTWRHTREPEERTQEGPVPGYSYTSGDELAIEAELPLTRGEDWRPVGIETFNSPDRPRIVLGIDLFSDIDSETLRDFLHDCAQDIVRRTRARVFFAETFEEGHPRAYYMWSPDGGGWTGRDGRNEVFVENEDLR